MKLSYHSLHRNVAFTEKCASCAAVYHQSGPFVTLKDNHYLIISFLHMMATHIISDHTNNFSTSYYELTVCASKTLRQDRKCLAQRMLLNLFKNKNICMLWLLCYVFTCTFKGSIKLCSFIQHAPKS